MKIGNDVMQPTNQVRNLAVYWNNLMTTMAYVNKLFGQLSGTVHAITCKCNIFDQGYNKDHMQSLELP